MTGHRRLATIGIVVAMVLVGATGCSKAADKLAEKAVESQSGGKVKIDSKDGSVKYSGEDGSETELNVGDGASIPDGWPAELNPPDDAVIVTSSTSTVDGKKSMNIFAEMTRSIDDIAGPMKQQITDAGFEISQDTSTEVNGAGYVGLTADRDDFNLAVAISQDTTNADKVSIMVTLTAK